MTRPETIEGRWDVLYREYPEVYEQFGRVRKRPDMIETLNERFVFSGKDMVDIGSGTGISTFDLARFAAKVVGIEIEQSMLAVALEMAPRMGLPNAGFMLGDAENIPLADNSVDVAIGVTLAGGRVEKVAEEMERVVKRGGSAIRVDPAPGWYGGAFNAIIDGVPRETLDEPPFPGSPSEVLPTLGYEYFDVVQEQQYGTTEAMMATYGFIHGRSVLEHIRTHRITSLRWKFRVHFKTVGADPCPPRGGWTGDAWERRDGEG